MVTRTSGRLAEVQAIAGEALWFLLRLTVGAFLIWGVWDNVASPDRMSEFAQFLTAYRFPAAEWLAPLSVYAQLVCGVAFITGFLVRPAGLICAVNFAVALAMVDLGLGVRAAFPTTLLIIIGLQLAHRGAGRISLDRMVGAAWKGRASRAGHRARADHR